MAVGAQIERTAFWDGSVLNLAKGAERLLSADWYQGKAKFLGF